MKIFLKAEGEVKSFSAQYKQKEFLADNCDYKEKQREFFRLN